MDEEGYGGLVDNGTGSGRGCGYNGGRVPRGFFCALVCGLMPRWKLRKKYSKLADVYKNFVQFTVDGCQIAVADTFYYVDSGVFRGVSGGSV